MIQFYEFDQNMTLMRHYILRILCRLHHDNSQLYFLHLKFNQALAFKEKYSFINIMLTHKSQNGNAKMHATKF